MTNGAPVERFGVVVVVVFIVKSSSRNLEIIKSKTKRKKRELNFDR